MKSVAFQSSPILIASWDREVQKTYTLSLKVNWAHKYRLFIAQSLEQRLSADFAPETNMV
jgi:hypothetical protein